MIMFVDNYQTLERDIGLVCLCCGVYFEDKHGYPVMCSKCYDLDDLPGVKPPKAIYKVVV